MSKTDIGERIKTLRAEQGLKQSELASKVGVSRSVISQIEIGRIFPTIETLTTIAHKFGRDYKWLIEGREENVSSESKIKYPQEAGALKQQLQQLKEQIDIMKELIDTQKQAIEAQERVIKLLEGRK